ncbi:MAG TPA: glycosyltransferase family 1 protein [Terriglobia bacterium]|jgi:glycosyltransferase involved in cell wall biosynthesis
MRIGINCLDVDPGYSGGINTYTFGLLSGFAAIGAEHQFQIYAVPTNLSLFDRFRERPNFKIVAVPEYQSTLKRGIRKAARMTNVPALYRRVSDWMFPAIARIMDANSDIIYAPTTVLFPYDLRKTTVISMHDIQQFHYPEFFSKQELISRHVLFTLSAQYVDYIQASSEFIKQDLLTHFNELRPEQIFVVPEGVNVSDFQGPREADARVREKYNLPADFLFYPAQLWPHKNHITVLKAVDKLKTTHGLQIPLVLTGAIFSAAEQIFAFIKERKMDYVRYLGKVPFADLTSLYRTARFMITSVLYESSSLCILEAAAAGTPIIASSTPPNVEMSAILDLNLFQSLDVDELAMLLNKIWNDEPYRKRQRETNSRNIEHYSWNNAARSYLSFFEKIEAVTDAGAC